MATGKAEKADVQAVAGGKTIISVSVVNKLASKAAGTVKGVYSLGNEKALLKTPIMELFRSEHHNRKDAVKGEIGNSEAAFDIDIVLEYGYPLVEVVSRLRSAIKKEIKYMLGRDVIEVNINVTDIKLPIDSGNDDQISSPRVK